MKGQCCVVCGCGPPLIGAIPPPLRVGCAQVGFDATLKKKKKKKVVLADDGEEGGEGGEGAGAVEAATEEVGDLSGTHTHT